MSRGYYKRKGERLQRYSESNYCATCKIWYSKDTRYCTNCGLLIRTGPHRHSARHSLFEVVRY